MEYYVYYQGKLVRTNVLDVMIEKLLKKIV
jgi:hypothetical protein